MEDTKMIRSHETEDSNTTHQKLEAGNQSQPEINLDDDTKFLDQLKGNSNSNTEMANSTTNEEPNEGIGWLPPILLEKNQKFVNTYCYPWELPIGPIYYNWSKVLEPDQNSKEKPTPARLVKLSEKFKINFDRKREMATLFITEYLSEDNGEKNALEGIRGDINNIKAAIHKTIDPSNECSLVEDGKLARLLFLDGCTILQFIRSYILEELLEKCKIDGHQQRLIAEELFLLQNQIPLKVIIELLSNVKNVGKRSRLIGSIARFLHMNNFTTDHSSYYGRFLCEKLISNYPENEPLHLLHLLYCVIRNHSSAHLSPPDARGIQNPDFRSVQELKSVGIDFKPSSRGGYISFSSRCLSMKGHLKLPPIIVDDRTECKMMNLVAYEMCLPTHTFYFHDGKYYASGQLRTQYPVTSYVKFMDVLVDKEEDVKELRASRVLRNRLSSDAHAAKLFNEMGSKCSEPASDLYAHVRVQMETHCKNNWAMWIAQVRDKHFSSPWTIVALLAAVLILLFTATQTWYAIRS